MFDQFKKIRLVLMVGLIGFAASSWAAGNHAGGHSHGADNSAIGQPGQADQVMRTIQVDMSDAMRFSPSRISVKSGETIKFVLTNSGKVKHEFVLGTEKDLKEHYQQMLKVPEMEHDEPNMVNVESGKSGTVIWKFSTSGTVDFACLLPGNYDAGMKGLVQVGATR